MVRLILIISFGISVFLSSCSSGSLMHRKYMPGYYGWSSGKKNKPLEKLHDTFSNAATKQETKSNNGKTPLFLSPSSPDSPKTNLKDSIVIVQKKGRNERQVFKNEKNYDIVVYQKEGRKDRIERDRPVRLNKIASYTPLVWAGLVAAIIPVLGLILSITAHQHKKELLEYGEKEIVGKNAKRLLASLVISITIHALIALFLIIILTALILAVGLI